MAESSNLDRLVNAGAVQDASHISDDHKRILNEEFSKEEIDAIIKLKDKITGMPFSSDGDEDGGMAAL